MRLASGQWWHFVATEAVMQWVENLASIMELKTCDENGYPKLIFVRNETDKRKCDELIYYLAPSIREGLPRRDWKVRELPLIHVWSHPDVPDVICELGHREGYELDIIRKRLALYPIYERAINSGGLPLHAALVERNGIGILLAASGNKGKSTCCRSLPLPWNPMCDDEALVVPNARRRYFAHPFPTWSDYIWRRAEQTWNVQRHVPLSAILFLERSETSEIVPIGGGQEAAFITKSAMEVFDPNWNNMHPQEVRALREKLLENACELAKEIPAYIFRLSLSGRFWDKIEKVIS